MDEDPRTFWTFPIIAIYQRLSAQYSTQYSVAIHYLSRNDEVATLSNRDATMVVSHYTSGYLCRSANL